MKTFQRLCFAALIVVAVASGAEAGKKGGGGGGGGGPINTNYGCATMRAGSTVYNSTTTKKLLMDTYTCYLCNMTTKVCAIQSPTTLVGWYFNLP